MPVDTGIAEASDTSASDSLPSDSAHQDTTITKRPTPSNDSLRQLTPQDTIPSGEPSTTSSQRVRVRADSLSARRGASDERLQELFGNVRVQQDSTRLRSLEAVRFLDSDEFLFTGEVVIYERGDTLRSTRVRYDRPSKVGRAFGAVHLSDGDVDVYSTRAVYYSEEKRSVFPDSVLLVDDDRTLTAASGVYYSDDQRAEFFGDVQVRDPDTYMEADSVRYFRNQERTEAQGNVFIDRNPGVARGLDRLLRFNQILITDPDERLDLGSSNAVTSDSVFVDSSQARSAGRDSAASDSSEANERSGEQTLLWGDRAENNEKRKTSRVTGRALLLQVRVDSAGNPSDTLMVQSHQLDASRSDTLDRMIAIDTVRIWQPDLAATADSVVYDRFYVANTNADETPDASRDSLGSERAGIRVPNDGQDDANTEDDRRASESEETVPGREETRLFQSPLAWFEGSQVKGDTIRVLVRNRSVDTVFVRSNAFAAQYDSVSTRVQQLTGQIITAVFRRDSIQSIIARPNARAIRFLTGSDGSPNGAAKTSSDRIVLRFQNGDVERVSVLGGTETTYYKQAIVPDPFQLDGYTWTPDAKPIKADFLWQPRVRERLNLSPLPARSDAPAPNRSRSDILRPDTLRPDTRVDLVSIRRSLDRALGPNPGRTEPRRGREASNARTGEASQAASTRPDPMPARRDTSTSSPRP